MAKLLSYTDPNTGAAFPSAVWFPVGLGLDASGPNVKVDFLAYKDTATAGGVIGAALGIPGAVKKGPIASISYTLTQPEFATLAMTTPSGTTVLDVISNVLYTVAASSTQNQIQDPAFPSDSTKKVGYFSGATDVDILG